ncbi:MAG TPA: imidazole glycerol phosphate synthase subunit HisH [Chitinivibrionales bacterium]|jgi:glutamine amidotransferase|nr:imidazole glycerol phosphate synthase subunit HisH [Chitinivibrionales bacterium]
MISIIDYKAGNLTSVKRALDFLGIECTITGEANVIRKSQRIIFPGVGNAASAVPVIRERGIDSALAEAFRAGTPILGICLGTQIILSRSEEGDTECLGLIKGNVARFNLSDPSLKVPHMGWNELLIRQKHVLLKDVAPGTQMYFVHSFYPLPSDASAVIAECEYGITFPCAIGARNLFATQFHPEKSGPAGLSILKNFAAWEPEKC